MHNKIGTGLGIGGAIALAGVACYALCAPAAGSIAAWLTSGRIGAILTRIGIGTGGGIDLNKLKHIFDKPIHKLGGLLSSFGGSQEKAYRALHAATQQMVKSNGLKGVFELTVNVKGQIIIVTGKVVDGVARIGTAYKK